VHIREEWNNMTILKTENVTQRFGGLVAVNNVSLEVEEGEILGSNEKVNSA